MAARSGLRRFTFRRRQVWLYPIFTWLQSNPAARWAAGIGGALALFWGWMTLRDRRIRSQAKQEARREVIEQIQEKTDEAVKRVEDDRARVRDLNDEQLRKLLAKDRNNRGRLPEPPSD